MSWLVEKLVDWWENRKYPEDKDKERRIDEIINQINKESNKYDPKKPRLIKN